MKRMGKAYRKTTETEVSVEITLNGRGRGEITTTIPFLNHMLDLFAKHGLFDLTVKSKGDTVIDDHHLVEDIGICLGEATKEALGDKKGIERYGSAVIPMDESLCSVAVDISGRPYLIYHADFGNKKIRDFDPALLREFFKSFSDHSGITLHINLIYGKNNHHIAEAIFKAFARAIREASSPYDRIKGVLSTKGSL
ncbi:MAG: imidazoleglycerol-phosphate dehydratase HisB [Syntrophales bacterium]|nr:imidazoleglycerol-phosphate dehydratase HisB [Syntrophales bacterium]